MLLSKMASGALGALMLASTAIAGEIVWPSYEWGGPLKDYMKEVSDGFVARNPGVTVRPTNTNFAGFFDKQFIEVTSGNPPAILTFQDPQIGRYIAANLLEPLTRYYRAAGIDPNTFPRGMHAAIKDGEVYGVPLQINPRALIYNQAMFDAAKVKVPTNVDEFYDALKALRDPAKGQFGFALLGAPVAADPTAYEILNVVLGFGAAFITEGKPTANSSTMLEAMTFYKRIYDEGLIPRGIDFMTHRELLYSGKIAMLASAPFAFVRAKTVNPETAKSLKTRVLPFPAGGRSFTIMTLLSVPKSLPNKDEAAQLLMEFLTDANQRRLVEKYASLPIRPVLTAAEIAEKYPDFVGFMEAGAMSPSSAPQGAEHVAPQINAAIKRHFESFVYGNVQVRVALNALQADLEKLVATPR
ncbi:MAG: extracellular solute-binding protein [Alphaproteobacteria bacterium]|nr:extracellular solute-binding protein [Alphaproteobacteria bacterium]